MSTKITRRPLNKGAPRFPSMQSQTQTEEGYIHRLVRAGTAWLVHNTKSLSISAVLVTHLPRLVILSVLPLDATLLIS